ncbi:Restriction endonuclease [Gigaspora margarita]|uniref:Restriction endonuclease n=1 Tax=Gigaspora margarita TaxID=4874 RepID=A0A8H3X3H5_GIGMA|nr:Restriction endonuclease [Gigaspora margarita]
MLDSDFSCLSSDNNNLVSELINQVQSLNKSLQDKERENQLLKNEVMILNQQMEIENQNEIRKLQEKNQQLEIDNQRLNYEMDGIQIEIRQLEEEIEEIKPKSTTNYRIGHDFEWKISKLLSKNGILSNVIPCRRGDKGIDIIATFNRRIVLIQCKNQANPINIDIIMKFQSAVHRFGDNVLSIIVYNSEKLNNFLTQQAKEFHQGSCPEIKVVSDQEIVDCIKGQGDFR